MVWMLLSLATNRIMALLQYAISYSLKFRSGILHNAAHCVEGIII